MATKKISDELVRLILEQKINIELDYVITKRLDRDKDEPSAMIRHLTSLATRSSLVLHPLVRDLKHEYEEESFPKERYEKLEPLVKEIIKQRIANICEVYGVSLQHVFEKKIDEGVSEATGEMLSKPESKTREQSQQVKSQQIQPPLQTPEVPRSGTDESKGRDELTFGFQAQRQKSAQREMSAFGPLSFEESVEMLRDLAMRLDECSLSINRVMGELESFDPILINSESYKKLDMLARYFVHKKIIMFGIFQYDLGKLEEAIKAIRYADEDEETVPARIKEYLESDEAQRNLRQFHLANKR